MSSMNRRQPVTGRRAAAVMVPTLTLCGLIWAAGRSCPLLAAGLIAATVAASAWALPFPGLPQGIGLAGKALRAVRAGGPAASAFGWNVLRACARPDATQEPATAGQHEAWVTHLRYIAQMQRDARPSHPDDCFCSCGIDPAALAWFRDDLEVIAGEMARREQERRGQ